MFVVTGNIFYFNYFTHYFSYQFCRFRVKVFNATFNNISAISWRSVLLVEENEIPGENLEPAARH